MTPTLTFYVKLNKDIKSIEDELNKALIEDLILAEGIYQSNINRNEVLNIANRMCIKNGWKFEKLNQILGN